MLFRSRRMGREGSVTRRMQGGLGGEGLCIEKFGMAREGRERWEGEDKGVGEDSWMRRVGTGR